MASVRLEGVRKVYENGHVALHDATFDVVDGEFMVLVGPSGCGKSTTLRMVAGLESVTAGRLWIGDRVVNDVPASARDIAMVFQNYALYPHMSVYDNMAFALKLRNERRAEIDRRVRAAAAILGIESMLGRKPRQLSGGQRQRVAVGRALVREPRVFLFDEPLSNLDAKLRVQMRKEISRLHRRLAAKTDQHAFLRCGHPLSDARVARIAISRRSDAPNPSLVRACASRPEPSRSRSSPALCHPIGARSPRRPTRRSPPATHAHGHARGLVLRPSTDARGAERHSAIRPS